MNIHPGKLASELVISVHARPPAEWPSVRAGVVADAVHFSIFQSREFIDTWLMSFDDSTRWTAHFVKVTSPLGEPLMLVPLCIARRSGMRILSFLDGGKADYNGPVLFSRHAWTREAMHELWRRILDALPPIDVVRLEKIPPTIDGLPNPFHMLAERPDVASTHGNRLDRPWPDVEKGMENPKRLRKKERALARIAHVEFLIAEDAEQQEWLLGQLIDQKQRRYEEMRVAGFTEKPEHLAFLRHATTVFAESGNLLLCALAADREAIAILWCLVKEGTALALINSHADGPWTRFSCGRLLDHRLIEHLHAHGFVYFDRGYGDEAYKLQNSDTTIPLFRHDEARSLKGRLFLWGLRLRAALLGSRLGEGLRQAKWILVRNLRSQESPPEAAPDR